MAPGICGRASFGDQGGVGRASASLLADLRRDLIGGTGRDRIILRSSFHRVKELLCLLRIARLIELSEEDLSLALGHEIRGFLDHGAKKCLRIMDTVLTGI